MLRTIRLLCLFGFPLLLYSCTTITPAVPEDIQFAAYRADRDGTLVTRHAPVFLIENPQKKLNRIGTPSASRLSDKVEKVFIDPDRATIYTRVDTFAASGQTYTNLLYRVHFEQIPGGLSPYYLGKGRNVGLIVVVTLNTKDQPILYTTVHTCGCYLAFVPTAAMPAEFLPASWPSDRQNVYSENLPALFAPTSDQDTAVILIRDENHRVKDIFPSSSKRLEHYPHITAEIKPFADLEQLPLDNHTSTSFYETSGSRRGYVKGSYKPRERLLMSWWAFDWRVGEDKKLGTDKSDGIVFYTSLKPWRRETSDMRDFVRFLRYWGWKF